MPEIIHPPKTHDHLTGTAFFNKKKAVFAAIPEAGIRQFEETMKTPISFSPRALHYYMTANKWAADLDFYSRESSFFRLLIENYTRSAVDAGHLGRLDYGLHRLAEQASEIARLRKSLADYLRHLTLIGEKKVIENPEWLADAHVSFEALINTFALNYRNEKLALFDLIEEFSI